MRSVSAAVALSAFATATLAAALLVGADGWLYYHTPVAERGYLEAHRLLRPSGRIGQPLGIGGFILMLVPVAYAIRKKVAALRQAGSLKTWLEVHVFCGIVGPVLVSFHTAFKFSGIVAVAYWAMVLVALSGVVGRYLYVRIPRGLRGQELTRGEIDSRLQQLGERIAAARLPESALGQLEAFEVRMASQAAGHSWWVILRDDLRLRTELRSMRESLGRGTATLQHQAVDLIAERAFLTQRSRYLQKTKRLFDLWHVFHMPLVYVMFVIVVAHVAVTVALGYVPLR